MKQDGLLTGSALFFMSSVLTFLARFAISVIVARSLGPAGKGVYTLVLTFGSLLVFILDVGLSSSLVYLVASRRFQHSELTPFAACSSLAIGGLGSFAFYMIYLKLLANNLFAGVDPVYIGVVLAVVPCNLLATLLSAVILGRQSILAYNLINIVRMGLNLMLQILSALTHLGISGAIGAWVISNLIALFFAAWLLRKELFHPLRRLGVILKAVLNFGVKSYAANLLTLFNYRLDSFILNYYAGSGAVGLYATGVAAAELVWYLPNAISSTLFPKSANLDPKTGARLTAKVCRQLILLTVPLALGFGLLGIHIIPLVYGKAFQASVTPFLLLLPGIIGVAITKVITANLSGIGKPQFSAYTAVVVFILTVGLDLALIPKYSLAGAAIASTIAYLSGSVLSVFWFSRESQIPWGKAIFPARTDVSNLLSLSAALFTQARNWMIRRRHS